MKFNSDDVLFAFSMLNIQLLGLPLSSPLQNVVLLSGKKLTLLTHCDGG